MLGYTITFTYDSISYEITPANEDIVFEVSDEDGIKRLTLATTLLFIGDDYQDLKTVRDAFGGCGKLLVDINYNATKILDGAIRFGSNFVTWNDDLCQAQIKVDSNDDYQAFFDLWEDEFNIYSGTTSYDVNISVNKSATVQCEVVGDLAVPPPDPLTPLGTCLEYPDSWSLVAVTYDDNYEESPGVFKWRQVTTYQRSTESAISAEYGSWVDTSAETPFLTNYGRPLLTKVDTQTATSRTFVAIDRVFDAVSLNQILDNFAPSGYTVVSNFFGVNPDGLNIPANDVYTIAADRIAGQIYVSQKTGVSKYNLGDPATSGPMTYKELLENLEAMFNTRYRVEGMTLRIEHVSYFDQMSNGFDITALQSGIFTAQKNEYSYDSTGVFRREEWSSMEETSQEFESPFLWYDCATSEDGDINEILSSFANNDVSFLVSNPDKVSDEGFCFMNCYEDAGNIILTFDSNESGNDYLPNGFMSWGSLLPKFHYYRRPLSSGQRNGPSGPVITFESSKRRKAQQEIDFPLSRDSFHSTFDYEELIKTELGWGEVATLTYSAKNCTVTVKINHQ